MDWLLNSICKLGTPQFKEYVNELDEITKRARKGLPLLFTSNISNDSEEKPVSNDVVCEVHSKDELHHNASDSVEQQNNESEGLGVFTLKFKQKLKARGRPVGSGAGVLKFHVNKSRKKSVRVPRSREISIVPSGDTTKAINFQDFNVEHDIDGNENSAQNTLVGDSDSEHHLCYFPPVLRGQ